MNNKILIVEDEAALYERLRRSLTKKHFIVDEYTKSYDEAIQRILKARPDVVLLDINLAGDKTGLDLGAVLDKEYKIPFIYVTSIDDDMTFSQGMHTNHEQYIVKTKPRLNIDDVTRAIHTVLHKNKENNSYTQGIIGLCGYLEEIKNMGRDEVSKVKVNFSEIQYFTTASFKNENNELVRVEKNYCRFMTTSGVAYFLRESLSSLSRKLPYHFVRVNDAHLINIGTDMKLCRINGSRIKINEKEFSISTTYKKEINSRLQHFYS